MACDLTQDSDIRSFLLWGNNQSTKVAVSPSSVLFSLPCSCSYGFNLQPHKYKNIKSQTEEDLMRLTDFNHVFVQVQ